MSKTYIEASWNSKRQ